MLRIDDSVDKLRMAANHLTPFAVMVRYPFTGTSPSSEEAQQALKDVRMIKEIISPLIKLSGEQN